MIAPNQDVLPFLTALLPILDGVLIAFVILRKRETASALAWSLAIAFLPIVGACLFLLFGMNRIPRRLRKKIAHKERFGSDFGFPSETRLSVIEGDYPDTPLGRIGRMLEGLGEPPRRSGNAFTVYRKGREAFEAMCSAMESAEHHIHLEYFIFRYDALGKHILKILERKIAAGVEVRVLIDGVGSIASLRIVDRVRRAGGEAKTFLPLFASGQFVSPNLRSHRKIVVCDGVVGFFGGLNVGVEYLGVRPASARGEQRPWHDLHARVAGPVVRDLQRLFVESWDFCTQQTVDGPSYFPAVPRAGDAAIQIIAGGPDRSPNAIREAYFAAFTRAQRRILVATPYLVPDKSLADALKTAARSGVEVQVLFQSSPPDRRLVYLCGLSFVEELLRAGVHVYGLPQGMMHAKACVVDSEWALLGTANLDNRSLNLNFEQAGLFDSGVEVESIEAELDHLLAQSRPYTLSELHERSFGARVSSQVMRLFAPLL